MRWLRFTPIALALLVGCSPAESDDEQSGTTRAQRDSALAESALPGSRAVGRAIDASETARERAAAIDSLTR